MRRAVVAPISLAVAVAVLVVAGRGDLATPPVGSAAELSAWLDRTDTVTATLAIVRLLALVVGGWLLVASCVGAAARMAGRARLAAVADRALPSALRRLASGAGAASVVVLTGVGFVAGGEGALARERLVSLPAEGDEGTATMSVVPDDEPTAETVESTTPDTDGTAEPTTPDEAPSAEPTTPEEAPSAEPTTPVAPAPETTEPTAPVPAPPAFPPAAPPTNPAPAATATTDATWTVARGDSFWSIAAETLADAWGRPPTDAEIEPYWRAVIAANRDRLVSGNADLIYAGQVFNLPPA